MTADMNERPANRRGRPRGPSGLSAEHELLLETFLAEEAARGRRPRGVEVLRGGGRRFLRFMDEQGKKADAATLADAYAYQGALLERVTSEGKPYSPRTVADNVNSANTFCDWLRRSGRTLDNPFASMRRVRLEKKLPENILKEDEMAALLDELRQWNNEPDLWNMNRRYRVHVIAELQYASGLRIAEVAALMPEDVDVERALVYVKDGKQGSNRIAFLTDYAACVLEQYRTIIRPLYSYKPTMKNSPTIFGVGAAQIKEDVNAVLTKACAAVGVPRITSHGFRHALGYHLLRAGCPLRYIQAILGHKLISTTEVYTKVDVDDAKAVFDACHPRMRG